MVPFIHLGQREAHEHSNPPTSLPATFIYVTVVKVEDNEVKDVGALHNSPLKHLDVRTFVSR
jgi:hypothetical protein